MLVKNAQNLMQAVIKTVQAAEAACMRVSSRSRERLNVSTSSEEFVSTGSEASYGVRRRTDRGSGSSLELEEEALPAEDAGGHLGSSWGAWAEEAQGQPRLHALPG